MWLWTHLHWPSSFAKNICCPLVRPLFVTQPVTTAVSPYSRTETIFCFVFLSLSTAVPPPFFKNNPGNVRRKAKGDDYSSPSRPPPRRRAVPRLTLDGETGFLDNYRCRDGGFGVGVWQFCRPFLIPQQQFDPTFQPSVISTITSYFRFPPLEGRFLLLRCARRWKDEVWEGGVQCRLRPDTRLTAGGGRPYGRWA